MATDNDDPPERFEDVDWESVDGDGLGARIPASTVAFLVLLAGLAGVVLYETYLLDGALYGTWVPSPVDYLSLLFGSVVVAYGLVPAILEPSRVKWVWKEYPKDVLSLLALLFVVGFVLVGVFGPVFVETPRIDFDQADQPPVGTSVRTLYVDDCVGPQVGDDRTGQCYGTWAHPLGTTRGGESILAWIVYGTRTALQFSLLAATLMAPFAVAVGTTTAYLGGWVKRFGMGFVDVLESVPTVVIYLFLVLLFNPKLIVLIVAYGLFDWGKLARLVHGETLTEKNAEYVLAARSVGAGHLRVMRHHLFPNVADTTLTAVTVLMPRLILIEALWSFLQLGGAKSYSWGQLISRGLNYTDAGQLLTLWWIPIVPVVFVSLTVVMLNLFGDGLQTVMDARR